MRVVVNGEDRAVAEDATVAGLLHSMNIEAPARGVAVARNGDVVLRGEWDRMRLLDGDRVEVLHAVQGG